LIDLLESFSPNSQQHPTPLPPDTICSLLISAITSQTTTLQHSNNNTP